MRTAAALKLTMMMMMISVVLCAAVFWNQSSKSATADVGKMETSSGTPSPIVQVNKK